MTRRSVPRRIAGVGLAGVLWPGSAEAHLVTSGLGPVYDGISHVLISPEDLVPVLVMGLAAGMNGPRAGRHALFVLTGSWLAGGIAGVLTGQASVALPIATASFLALGGLVAFDLRLSPAAVRTIAAGVGLLHGWMNGIGIASAGHQALGLAGIAGTVFVVAALSASAVIALRAPWSRVAIRVAGSWVAATGLLMLGWGLRGQ